MIAQGNTLIKVALQLLINKGIHAVEKTDDSFLFITSEGEFGFIEPNDYGRWDVWIGEEMIYEVENEIRHILEHEKDENLIQLYNYVKSIDTRDLQIQSLKFLTTVKVAMENLICSYRLPLKGIANIRNYDVIYTSAIHPFTINVN